MNYEINNYEYIAGCSKDDDNMCIPITPHIK